jgi:hypothetical protein
MTVRFGTQARLSVWCKTLPVPLVWDIFTSNYMLRHSSIQLYAIDTTPLSRPQTQALGSSEYHPAQENLELRIVITSTYVACLQ